MRSNRVRILPSSTPTETSARVGRHDLPELLTIDEAAALLRTTRRAIYAMIARHHLPGVVRVRRRVLLRADALCRWLDAQCSTPIISGRTSHREPRSEPEANR